MLLRCIRPFGNFTPGDEVEVPDGAVFDSAYFEQDAPEPAPVAEEAPGAPKEEGK